MTNTELIAEIETHAQKVGLSPSTVTGRAVNNSRLYARLKSGGSCTLAVADQLRAYIAEKEKGAA